MNNLPREFIFDKISNKIIKDGIPEYVKIWKLNKDKIHDHLKNIKLDIKFLKTLNKFIKQYYHYHSGLSYNKKNFNDKALIPQNELKNPIVKLYENNIGYIKFFTCSATLNSHKKLLYKQALNGSLLLKHFLLYN